MTIWIYWHSKDNKGKDTVTNISDIVSEVKWSGADTQASRTLTISVPNDPFGQVGTVDIMPGDDISMYCDEEGGKKRCFYGQALSSTKVGEVGTKDIECYDYMRNLITSKISHKYGSHTAEYIARDAVKRAGLTTGKMERTKVKIDKLYATDTSAYNIALKAYRKASSKNGVKYFPYMDGKKFCVKVKGETAKKWLTSDADLTKFEWKYDATDIINKINVYSNDGTKVGTISDKGSIKKYGAFMDSETAGTASEKTGGSKGSIGKAKKSAKAKLKKSKRELSLEAIGDIQCVSGVGVYVEDKVTKTSGKFWVMSDVHTWSNGQHTMSLTLRFKNTMENPSVEYQAPNSSGSSGSGDYGTYEFNGKVLIGKKVRARFTAYGTYLGTIGAYSRNIAFHTVAGPRQIKRKWIQISGTGTSWDGRVCKVSDTGEKHTICIDNKGIYHIDVCCRTIGQARAFGAHYGWIIIGSGKGYKKTRSVKWKGGKLRRPCGGPITSGFGRRAKYSGGRQVSYSNFHHGIDFGVATGTRVHAAAPGTVVFSGWYSGYGNAIFIQHKKGFYTLYAHMSHRAVSHGQTVKAGQYIGKSGSTGFVTGSCLHFGVYIGGRGEGNAVNPRRYL